MATLAPALIGLGTGLLGTALNLFGGNKAAQAAKEAALLQQEGAVRAGQGVMETTAATNKDIISSADRSSQAVGTAAGEAGKTVFTQADRANALLDPYRATGDQSTNLLTKYLSDNGLLAKMPTAADIQMDPGVQARLKLGLDQLDRVGAARGGAVSGTALMGLEDYRQTTASSEYDKAFQRYRQSTGDIFNRLNEIAGRGKDVAGAEGNNLINAGRYSGDVTIDSAKYGGDKIFNANTETSRASDRAAEVNGDYITQAANAAAAGKVGSANAWQRALGGVGSSVTAGADLYALLKNPTRPMSVYGPPVVYPQP